MPSLMVPSHKSSLFRETGVFSEQDLSISGIDVAIPMAFIALAMIAPALIHRKAWSPGKTVSATWYCVMFSLLALITTYSFALSMIYLGLLVHAPDGFCERVMQDSSCMEVRPSILMEEHMLRLLRWYRIKATDAVHGGGFHG